MDDQPQGKSIEERLADATALPQAADEQQPEPMPSSDQTPPEESPLTPDQGSDELTLPAEASDRTKREFEKLKQRLAEKEARLKELETPPQSDLTTYGTSVFDSFRPQETPQPSVDASQFGSLNQQQVQQIATQFVDPTTGDVDINGLNQALANADARAAQAERAAREAQERIIRFEENLQAKEAHAEFPELDPLNKGGRINGDKPFDPDFWQAVRDRTVTRNYLEGRNLSLVEIAREVSRTYHRPTVDEAKVKEQAVADYKQTQALRNQGPIEPGRGETRQPFTETELRERTRQGDPEALDERLRNLGILSKT